MSEHDAEPAEAAWRAPLDRLRHSIDNIDAALVHLLAERFKCTQAVGALKAAHGLPAADPAREAAQIARLRALAQTADLDPRFAEKFLGFIVAEVIRHHAAHARPTPTDPTPEETPPDALPLDALPPDPPPPDPSS